MIDPETRKAVLILHEKGMGGRKIARYLGIARNTVKEIILQKGVLPDRPRGDKIVLDEDLLRRLYAECDGYKERVYEMVLEECADLKIAYSTLTRRLRELGIGEAADARCDRVPDEPGAEMQHDTTVYNVLLGKIRTKLVASIVYMRYSKRKYLKFYRGFNRFNMKCFLHEALSFWEYVAPVCIIDNTNLARLRGSGKNAVIAPEMEAFSKRYGFRFQCHAIKHPNRKAGNERSFFTTETNFFPGRRFESLEDLNRQALDWATVKMENRPVSKSKLIPAKAFEFEKAYLTKLPPYLPAPYKALDRDIDQYGYVPVDGNFYWVPGKGRGEAKVLLYSEHIVIYQGRKRLIDYPLSVDGVKNECMSPKGYPLPRYKPKNRKKPTAEEEKRLRAISEGIDAYLDFSLKDKSTQKRNRHIRELFRLSRQMSSGLFCKVVERALKYRVDSAETIYRIAQLQLCENFEPTFAEVDTSFYSRDSYLEGRLSDEPDFSPYDDLLEEDDE